MNEHLLSSVKRDKRKEYLIAPFSKVDAEIVGELIIILGKLKDTADIKLILEAWKFLSDKEVLGLFLEWNLSHPEGFLDDEKENTGRKFVEFEGELIELQLIKSIHKDNHYNYNTNMIDYRIVVNKDFPEGSLLSDLYFSYPTSEARDGKLNKLKKNLSKDIKIV